MLYILYILVVFIIVLFDQYSKFIIVNNITNPISVIDGFFSITNVRNYGAGFSILQNEKFFLICISSLALLFISYLLIKTKSNEKVLRISYLFMIGGTIGNLIDRVRLGYVIDFLDFIIFKYDFPVFNIADSFLTVGCFLLIITLFLEKDNAKN